MLAYREGDSAVTNSSLTLLVLELYDRWRPSAVELRDKCGGCAAALRGRFLCDSLSIVLDLMKEYCARNGQGFTYGNGICFCLVCGLLKFMPHQ